MRVVPTPRCSVILSEPQPGPAGRVCRHHRLPALGAVPRPALLTPALAPRLQLSTACHRGPFSTGSAEPQPQSRVRVLCLRPHLELEPVPWAVLWWPLGLLAPHWTKTTSWPEPLRGAAECPDWGEGQFLPVQPEPWRRGLLAGSGCKVQGERSVRGHGHLPFVPPQPQCLWASPSAPCQLSPEVPGGVPLPKAWPGASPLPTRLPGGGGPPGTDGLDGLCL